MRAFEKYTFKLVATPLGGGTATEHIVHPSYDALKLKYAKESGEMYFNKSIDTEFTFINEDFVFIFQTPMLCKFELQIMAKGAIVERASFRKTDCIFDCDNMAVKAKVNANEMYSKIKSKMNDEYNLLKLGVAKRNVNYQLFPMIQYYEYASTNLVNIIGGETYTNESPLRKDGLEETLRFDKDEIFDFVELEKGLSFYARFTIPSGYPYSGDYEGLITHKTGERQGQLGSVIYYYRIPNITASNAYYLEMEVISDKTYYDEERVRAKFSIYDSNDELVVVGGNVTKEQTDLRPWEVLDTYSPTYALFNAPSMRFFTNSYQGAQFLFFAEIKVTAMFSRVVGNTYTHNFAVGTDDPFSQSKVYINFAPISGISQHIETSTTFSNEDKGYGETPDHTRYYDKPSGVSGVLIPIYKTCWSNRYSFWLNVTEVEQIVEGNSVSANCPDCYEIGRVLKALLREIDDRIVFEPTSEYSHFLYDEFNPIEQGAEQQGEVCITPKTNIMYTGYDYPAWKAPIRLNDLFEFFKNALNCYWYIDRNRHFHLEHAKYFINGLSYGNDERMLINLNERYDAHNGKPQSYHTNNWRYDGGASGGKQVTRYEFGWMDDTGEIFDDYPIIVPEAYRFSEEEETKSRIVTKFTSDINFIFAVPEVISQDGFAVMKTQYQSDDIVTGYAKLEDEDVFVQNNKLSFSFIIDKYMLYNIASKYVTYRNGLVGRPIEAFYERMKSNEVTFQYNDDETITENEIIVTKVGNGNVESLELDLATNTASAKLTYELE